MSVPCKDCQDRAPRCHGRCPKYAAYKEAKEEENARRRRENAVVDAAITNMLRLEKISKHHGRKGGGR